ncbi:Flp family type IVb pilin [Vibrio sp. S4M6]|uniref:Flp family type IVb pilin n=1 Tax=Vibrio sinus TaxID=2946865 RepID=UPI00202A797D|nr:Flp family type IVb pilin [Vibrio sinus]MCL9780818.1 Flp family type IVb pilin [Vibrio sinus]
MLTKLVVKAQMSIDNCKQAIAKFTQDENGVTAIEYSIIAAIMGGVIYVGLTQSGLATNIKEALKTVAGYISVYTG